MPRLSKNTSEQNEVLNKKDTKNEAVKRVSKEKQKKVDKKVLEQVKNTEVATEEVVAEVVAEVVEEPVPEVEEVVAEVSTLVESESKPAAKKRQSKPRVEKSVTVVEQAEPEKEETSKTDDDVTSGDEDGAVKPRRARKNVSTDNICSDLDSYIDMVDVEMSKLKKSNSSGVKFLKLLNKNLKNLKVSFTRYMKKKPKSTRLVNTNAGFSKPVKVSEQMAAFIGLPSASELVSRVFVTKFLCQYIKSNDLQNPNDKRQIVADSNLSTLLNYNPSAETEPLTYYRMQTYMRPHFL